MKELTVSELRGVSGGVMSSGFFSHIWHAIEGGVESAYDTVQGWNQEMWASFKSYAEAQPGAPGCNALGDVMGPLSHTSGLSKGDAIVLAHAGSACQKGANAVKKGANITNQRYNHIGK